MRVLLPASSQRQDKRAIFRTLLPMRLEGNVAFDAFSSLSANAALSRGYVIAAGYAVCTRGWIPEA
ncbi:MAG: hypothetical protein AAGH71_07295 [Planctomycetota bacterium]